MDHLLSEEEISFQEQVSRFIRESCPFQHRQEIVESSEGFSREHWKAFADLGWFGVTIGEEYGGLGLGDKYLAILLERLGRGLILSPFIPTVVVAAAAIEAGANEDLRRGLLPRIAAGDHIVAFAADEVGGIRASNLVRTEVTPEGGKYSLNGRKSVVAYAHVADQLLVTAQDTSAMDGGQLLLLVDADAPGVHIETYRLHDGSRASEVTFSDVAVPVDRVLVEDMDRLPGWLRDRAAAALCADMLGSMCAAFELTNDYLKTREQFGSKLASFQALQHRMVDCFIKCELNRALATDAMLSLRGDRTSRMRAVSAAKYRVGTDAAFVAKEAVQLHGGIGLTREAPVGHYLKRVMVANRLHGEPLWHRARYRDMRKGVVL